MKYIKEKSKLYRCSIDTIKDADDFYSENFMRGKYGMTQETCMKLDELIQKIIGSITTQDILIDSKIKETEEEAKEYFGEEFIKKFEEIRRFCYENNISLAIHGTSPENMSSIQKMGLEYDRPDISETALIQSGIDQTEEYNSYSDLLNWKHREYKGLVMIGIPSECHGILAHGETETKPLWEEIKENSRGYRRYKINPEFILGCIDVNKRRISQNPSFSVSHNYTNIKHYDNALTNYGNILSIPIEMVQQLESENIDHEEQQSDISVDSEVKDKTGRDLLEDVNDELIGVFKILIRSKGEMEGKSFEVLLENLQNAHIKLKMAIPQLKKDNIVDEDLSQSYEMDESEQVDDFDWGDDLDWDDDGELDFDNVECSSSFIATLSEINSEISYLKAKGLSHNQSVTQEEEVDRK